MVAGQVGDGGGAGGDEVRVVGAPRGEMVFREDCEVGTLGCGLADVGLGFGEVLFDGEVLVGVSGM